jgi:succinyl-diaminopimelate desuccinylase
MSIQERVLALTCSLIERESVTPDDAGCQAIIGSRLRDVGFQIQEFEAHGVRNLWASIGDHGNHLLFAGHTDVVPAGNLEEWDSHPFTPTLREGKLFGRGASDMKASLASMVVAAEDLVENDEIGFGRISFLITSDEEGPAVHGTKFAIEQLSKKGICPDFCIVGEPSSSKKLGDTIRCGRRGSINAHLQIKGIQGHVAYPDDARNPIHESAPAIYSLISKRWDEGNDYFPPTSLQFSNVQAGAGATNVIPSSANYQFNVRFNNEQTAEGIRRWVAGELERHNIEFEIAWQLSGLPFLTERGFLVETAESVVQQETEITPTLSTGGGTSDGRFIAKWKGDTGKAVEVIELGPSNASIHQVNEYVEIRDLAPLSRIYRKIARDLIQKKQD